MTPRGVAGCGGSKARSGLGNTGIDGSAGIGSSTCGSQCGVARLNNPRSASTTASARPLSVPVIDLSYDDDDEEGDGTGGQSSNFELGRELSGVSDFGNGATSRARRAEERWKRGKAMGGEEDSPTALAAAALDESATAEGQKEPVTDGAACPPEDSKTRVLGCPYFTAQVRHLDVGALRFAMRARVCTHDASISRLFFDVCSFVKIVEKYGQNVYPLTL